MEEIVLQTNWGVPIAIYLFLGGLAAGTACAVAVINLITGEKFKNTLRWGSWSGAIALAVGVFCLLLEVGLPFRALILFQSFVNFGSWMALGAWFLFFGILIYGLYALCFTERVTSKIGFLAKGQTVLSIIVIPLSFGIAVYTGILLGVLWARPLWNTWFLPALFTVSAFDTGVALVTAYAILAEPKTKEGLDRLKKALEISTVALVVLELIVLGSYLGMMLSASGAAALSARVLTGGPLSLYFWIIIVVLGLVTPLIVSLLLIIRSSLAGKTRYILPVAGIVCCLAGGFTLRWLILLAGLPVYS